MTAAPSHSSTSFLLTLLLGATSVSAVEVAFDTAMPVGTENGPRAVEVVDWDQDGRLDVLTASYDGDRLRRLMNTESGWLSLSLGTFVNGPAALASGDLDNDGTPDLVYTGADDDTLRVLLNRSSNFLLTVDSTLDHGLAVAIADIDSDGNPDLVATSFGGGQLYWYDNLDGSGESWNRLLVATPGGGPRSVVPADIDGDGDLDLVVVTFGGEVLWYENRLDSTAVWLEHTVDNSVPSGWELAVGDLDGDGSLDIVGGSHNTPRLIGWRNPGPPATGAWTRDDIATIAVVDIELADLDHDGDLDIGMVEWGTSASAGLHWYENLDHALDWEPYAVAGGYNTPRALAIADLDQDGDRDLVIGGGDSDVIESAENLTVHRSARFDAPSIPIVVTTTEGLVPEGTTPVIASGVGDFDGDGDPDLLSYEINNRLYWRDNLGSGAELLQAISEPLTHPRAFVVGDVDGDGDLDVVIGTPIGVEFLENTGVPGVWSRHTITNRDSIVALWLADINGDARLDLVGVDSDAQQVRWWRQAASSNWFDNFLASYTTFRDLAIGDVDLDGQLEVVVARESTVVVRERISDSVWDESTVGAAFTSAITLADLDGDGDLDVALSNPISAGNAPLRAFRNNLGSWSLVITPAPVPLTSLAAVDIDDDGDLDLVGGSAAGTTHLALNPGDASLTFAVEPIQLNAQLVEVVDFDLDGKLDLFGHRGSDGPLAKYEVGGQYSLGIAPIPEPSVAPGTVATFAHLDLLHLGRPGDRGLFVGELGLVFTDEWGNIFPPAQAQDLFESVAVWRDDGNGEFGPEDTKISVGQPTYLPLETHIDIDHAMAFGPPASSTTPALHRLFVGGELANTGQQSFDRFGVGQPEPCEHPGR